MNRFSLLADIIVAFHFCYVFFAVGGEILVLLGGLFRWRWVRSMSFRIVHLSAVVLVAVEALAGVPCPLTTWEYQLRAMAGQGSEKQISFIVRLVRSIIFYDFPSWVFIVAYVCFAVLVGLTFLFVAPRRKRRAGG